MVRPIGSRVAPGNCTPRPSQIPDMTVSGHPARVTPRRPAGRPRIPTGSSRCRLARRRHAMRMPHPLRSLGVTPAPRYYEVVRPSPAHRYVRPRGSPAWAFSLGITGKVLPFRTEAQAGVMSPVRRTPPGQSTGSRQAAPRAYLRPWFWRRRCPFDASSGIRLRSSLQPPPDGCSRLFHDAHDRGF